MELTFKQVETIFAERFGIEGARAVKFRARLQYLQRNEIPSDVNTGKGARASYGWKQVIQLMVALDLLDLGLPSEIAIRRVKQNSDQLIAAIRRVVHRFETERKFVNAVERGSCSIGKAEYILTSAAVFSYDMTDSGAGEFLRFIDGKSFHRSLTDDTSIEPMAAFVNIGTRMMLVANLVGAQLNFTASETAHDLRNWLEAWANEDTLS